MAEMISSIVVSPRAHVCHRDPLAPDQEPPDSSSATQGKVDCRSRLSPTNDIVVVVLVVAPGGGAGVGVRVVPHLQ